MTLASRRPVEPTGQPGAAVVVVTGAPVVTTTEDRWYGYTDSSDSPAWSQATSGGAYTTYLSNLVVTGTTPSYQISDPKGTVVGTVTQAGAFTATPIPDEYGNIASVPASRLDWLGTQKRFVDHPGLDIVRMGVRAYDPHLGRFLSQDPIVGGSANDYDYVNADPINGTDLGGTWGSSNVKRWVRDRGRSVNRHRWQIASLGVSALCIAASGGMGTVACAAAGVTLLAAKTRATIHNQGSIGDHIRNVATTLLFSMSGAGWAAAGAEMSGWGALGARAMGNAFGVICGASKNCAAPSGAR